MTKEPVEIEVVYTGRCRTTDKKIGYMFQRVTGEGLGAKGIFAIKRGKVFGIGVYGVKVSPEVAAGTGLSQIFSNTLRWKRTWGIKSEALAWEVEDETFGHTIEAVKLAKNAKGAEITKLCQPLAAIYRGLSPFQRSAFLTLVLDEVRTSSMINRMKEDF